MAIYSRPLTLLSLVFLVGCGGPAVSPATFDAGDAAPADTGNTFATPEAAPKYEGAAFGGMQIYDLESDVYLDDTALLKRLDETQLVFFGEQHETAPVQELELWLLQKLTTRYPDVSLAMEHFQHDEQPIVDKYLASAITSDEFEKTAQPWKNYATYWKPLVEHMKTIGRPIVALNVPDEALQALYAKFPTTPLNAFNAWDSSFKYNDAVAPRPLPAWDATYKAYFEGSFDYEAHGKMLGLNYADALNYFTDLAHIRDETMAYFIAQTLKGGGRVMTVAGDWHVQTGLATPDRTLRYGATGYGLVTTTPLAKFGDVKSKRISDRKLARFVLVYEAR